VTRLIPLETSARVLFPALMVGSLYLLFAGHNQPGGGFVGGLVAGCAIALRYVSGGIDEVRSLTRLQPWTILGSGLLLAGVVAALPVVLGDPVLEVSVVTLHPPLLGTVKVTSSLFFDVGVYVLVVGLVLMVFEAFGDEPPEHDLDADAGDGGDR
jgi:multicomponent Na+:H+ antiporter subunit A